MAEPRSSFERTSDDGRNINTDIGELSGEAASQISTVSEQSPNGTPALWSNVPGVSTDDPTYYDVPMLKEPVWESAIPLYYYVGGVTGALLVLGAAAQLDEDNMGAGLSRHCRYISIVGSGLSGVLLVYDLGRPSRFLNMLRVFRPTSPMNVGAWILSGTGASATAAEFFSWFDGPMGSLARLMGYVSGVFGAGLMSYTGVLW